MLDTYDASIYHVRYHQTAKFSSSGCLYLIAETDDGEVIKGEMDVPIIGEMYRFYGEWVPQKKYNNVKAFCFQRFEVVINRTVDGISAYLSRYVIGLGSVRARRLVERFGTGVLDVLRDDPGQALVVDGITEKTVEHIRQHFEDHPIFDPAAYGRLAELFEGLSVPKKLIEKLIDDFGSNAPDFITKHPYELMNYNRMGWAKTDKFARQKVGYDSKGPERYKAAILEVMARFAANDGHTVVPKVDIDGGAMELCGTRPPAAIWDELVEEGRIVPDVDGKGNVTYALIKLHHAEREIARLIGTLQDNAIPLDFQFDVSRLEGEQVDAARLIERFGVSILAGAPGTGKTHVTMEIVSQLENEGIGPIIIVCPTGKAAKRAAEVLEEKIPGSQVIPSTIHKALGIAPSREPEGIPAASARIGRGREGFGFEHNEDNPLQCSVAIMDETSMADVLLMYYFLRALPIGCRLILVGDPHQLPSVGPGSTLRDLILAKLPTALLTQPRRNSGRIVMACHDIKNGKVPMPAAKIDLRPEVLDNWRHIEESDPDRIAQIIVELHQKTKMDPLWDVQCISPENKKKAVACSNLNRLLSRVLNKTVERDESAARKSSLLLGSPTDGKTDGKDSSDAADEEETPFRIGDKVIRTKNGAVNLMVPFGFKFEQRREMRDRKIHQSLEEFERELSSGSGDEDGFLDESYLDDMSYQDDEDIDFLWDGKPYSLQETYVVNGDLGIVLDIVKDKKTYYVIVQFKNPDRLCRIAYSDHKLAQAYAVTVHKFQGSGVPYVIFPLHDCFYWNTRRNTGIFCRELVYTAFSRAELVLVTVGKLASLRDAIGRKTIHARRTKLVEYLKAMQAVGPEMV